MPAKSQLETLVLNGSPGSGKNTIADAISELLRENDVAHAVIDIDELGRVYPESDHELAWDNLAAVWPNYETLGRAKVILPVCIDDRSALNRLKSATPCRKLTICELTAPIALLKARVTEREPNEHWRSQLRNLVDAYANRPEHFGDFHVSTESKLPVEAAAEIINRIGWITEK